MMPEYYTESREDVVTTFRRVHANSEQTHVVIVTAGENDYVAVAYDIDPREYRPVAAETVAFDPTLEGVVERAEAWMRSHPKGVAGDGDGGGLGVFARLWAWLQKLDQSATPSGGGEGS